VKRIDLKDLAEFVKDKGFIVNNHCYKCNKISYGTEKGAKVIAAEMFRRGKGHSYVYECPKENGWHLTSEKPASAKNPKVRKKTKFTLRKRRGHS
tara:strand:+ start:33 stop:317 length:285 start_codon:yes stop_codon:yes gene_type:complete